MDVVRHRKTFKNITLQPLPLKNSRVIAPVVQIIDISTVNVK